MVPAAILLLALANLVVRYGSARFPSVGLPTGLTVAGALAVRAGRGRGGARRGALGADVIIQELEDFTPPELRPKARACGRLSSAGAGRRARRRARQSARDLRPRDLPASRAPTSC